MRCKKRALLGLVLAPLCAGAATPVLSGLYSVGEAGLVEFSMQDGKIVGRSKATGLCSFAADTSIVTGSFEGSVFVGTVTLCQEGGNCPAQRTYPMLGVWHDDAVAGWIRLDAGCRSPALDGRALFFRPATVEEKQKFLGSEGSAAAHALKNNKGDPVALALDALNEGNRLLQDLKFGAAREKFRQALELDETRWEAHMGFGVAEVKLNRAERSLESFDKALAVAAKAKTPSSQIQQIHYNRACAQAALGDRKGAVASLRVAIKVAPPANLVDALQNDTDLDGLRTDPDFKRLVKDAVDQARKKPR